MCLFEMRLILCGCEDPECRQREPQLVGVLAENGHPLKINWYYRRGRMCTGYFTNRDPNRLVVRLGLAADNTNSTMDCTNKVIRIEGDPERSTLRQRRRAAEACNVCRETKKKCSGSVPCTHCLRRGIAAQCAISFRPSRGSRPSASSHPGPGAASRPRIASSAAPAPARVPVPTPQVPPPPGTGSPATGPSPGHAVASTATPRPDTTALLSPVTTRAGAVRGRDAFQPPPSPPSEPHPSIALSSDAGAQRRQHRPSDASIVANPHSRMLLNLRGERVYIGGAASLSFLQLVRGMVADQIGPSQFSHNAQSETMLEKESPSSTRSMPVSSIPELDTASKLAFSRCYRAVTEGFLDVFAPSELEDAFVGGIGANGSVASPQRRAALDLVVAIGAQVKSAATARDVGPHYFRQAQRRAFDGMLEDPDIDMVRCFLLMAFYLLGECRRNAAFMYLGIATRAGVALGLHSRESYTDMSDGKDNLRMRVWLSLRIVDMLANSILGRPAATAGLHSDINSIIEDMESQARGNDDDMRRLIASHQIVCIINGIVDTLYDKKELSIPVVEQLLNEIETWAKGLPDCIRSPSLRGDASTAPNAHKGAIGSIHVSCLYYFAVTLATRPILISTLTAPPASGGLAQSNLASACLDAAVFLSQTCVEARRANLLYGNMCIMKALVFAAGLVLGFEIFAKRSIDYDIESAFGGARDVLNFLATQSPQAAHYYEILTLLANAITKQREKIASKGRSRYVSRLFTLDSGDAERGEGTAAGPGDRSGEWVPGAAVDYTASLGEDGKLWVRSSRQAQLRTFITTDDEQQHQRQLIVRHNTIALLRATQNYICSDRTLQLHTPGHKTMGSNSTPGWRRLSVGVVGGGIGGMSAAIALRRAGHEVTIYEKSDFAGEVGASVSCAANGTRWLHEWKVDVAKGDPVVLRKLINRDWKTGEPVSVYDLSDYEERWGHVYNMFHRQDMHRMLKDCALQDEGEGTPAKLVANHKCQSIDVAAGVITFCNGATAQHDLVVGADGIGSAVRGEVGIKPAKRPAEQSCLHTNVTTEEAVRAGLVDYSRDSALEYWGGQEGKWDKIVLSPCNDGKLLSYYCFFPRDRGDYATQTWAGEDRPVEELLAPYPELDRRVFAHLAIGKEIRPWRLWLHDPYPYLCRGRVSLLGDAGHPMMPHQSQGACMAIEDAAALGILFGRDRFRGDVDEALAVYSDVRLPRVTRVQAAAAKAAYNINERIGFSVNKDTPTYKVEDPKKILTIEEMNAYDMFKDVDEHLAARRGVAFTEKFVKGLPMGLKLPSGITIGESE
ncbi:Fungal specific transcription factor [Purpureocillium lavendulum]|uniref:Fungal specific transcription factor n=1 Tax=Purpureocillium lavendulum TaxID=1247861 RepID=A0AB34FQQ8_9HYPO|nr:Fungal specific transcription factor [Purpureocillium lavendulum]